MATAAYLRAFRLIDYNIHNTIDKQNKYLQKTIRGCSEIYEAYWIDGRYYEWDSKEKQLNRNNRQYVVLKKLKNIESANRSWFEEGKSHLSISNKYGGIAQCFGLTKDPSDENFMLVMSYMNANLREYLQQNYNKLTWKERIQIINDITLALSQIYKGGAIHRDLHSGNVLFQQKIQTFRISDLGFCGPPDKPLNSIYGNLPYIAPEVISGKETTFASDIYSIGILMWEISSGQPPFLCKHNYDLAIKIINGMRPKIIPGTPLKYKELMEQCWDADPTKRPNAITLIKELSNIYSYYLNNNEQQQIISDNFQMNSNFNVNSSSINSFSDEVFSSKVYTFQNMPEPRNATKEEQAYHSIQLDFDLRDGLITDDEKESYVNSKKIKLNNNKGDDENLNLERDELKISF
ncbi:kinase-like domain-containing protein [Rhizophagus clarus]|uniref:Kinase-like domain-containing protein n=1 Tax=Rhizophagus clarus TaxID=94130 RepID=A0A8H3QIY6_9GLOM|nr:kinase-like domain-containing protein [Rhizophagus clarus]